jgi:hypothetical protein
VGLSKDDDDGTGEDEEEEEDGGVDADDVHNFHFVEVPALFVAYSYVTAAAKVFEERKITRDLRNLPDFEIVYQLGMCAIILYCNFCAFIIMHSFSFVLSLAYRDMTILFCALCNGCDAM